MRGEVQGSRFKVQGDGFIVHRSSFIATDSGAALIVALWVLLVLSLLIGSFAYDMHIESHITAHYRNRMKAQYLARGGVEWAKLLLAKSYEVSEDDEGEDENLIVGAINLSRGAAVTHRTIELGEGKVVVDIVPEQGRYNVNGLDDEQWEEILDYSGVPQELWDELIDCFYDWVDEDDLHLINGAESDDNFYQERGYPVKNGPVDLVGELLLIKGFDQRILFGGPAEDKDEEPMKGIASQLTTWGDGKINVNTASLDTLTTLVGDEGAAAAIVEQRRGEDGEEGTRDDGFESIDEVMAIAGVDPEVRDRMTVTERRYVRVVSIGDVNGVRSGIWCVLLGEESGVTPVYWREESMQ